jgi:hypothetical protein
MFERIRDGQTVPGVIEVDKKDTSIGVLIDDLEVMIGAGTSKDFGNQVNTSRYANQSICYANLLLWQSLNFL